MPNRLNVIERKLREDFEVQSFSNGCVYVTERQRQKSRESPVSHQNFESFELTQLCVWVNEHEFDGLQVKRK